MKGKGGKRTEPTLVEPVRSSALIYHSNFRYTRVSSDWWVCGSRFSSTHSPLQHKQQGQESSRAGKPESPLIPRPRHHCVESAEILILNFSGFLCSLLRRLTSTYGTISFSHPNNNYSKMTAC